MIKNPSPFNSAKINALDAFHFRVPLKSPRINSFGKMTHRPALIVRLRDENGVEGWGECFCNWPSFAAEHRYNIITEIISPLLVDQSLSSPQELAHFLRKRIRILRIQSDERGPFDQVLAAVDIATWDLVSRRAGVPLYKMLGGSLGKTNIPVYASGLAPGAARRTVESALEVGISTFKLKVGFGLETDIAELTKLRSIIGKNSNLMVDANQSWTMGEAEAAVYALEQFNLEWLEEPIPADSPIDQFAKLAAISSIAISAGENVRGIDEFSNLMKYGGVTVIQPDIIKWGGITECRKVALEAINQGLRYCPHYLGGGVGLIATAHLLAAVGGDGLLELDTTVNPLRELLAQPFPEVRKGYLQLSENPGLGIEPNMKDLATYLVKSSQNI